MTGAAPAPDVLCIGAVLWDVIGRSAGRMDLGHDVPGRIRHLPGGVALNVALALARRGLRPAVLGAVGHDAEGHALCETIEAGGVDTRWLVRDTGLPTDVYMAIEDSDGLIAAIADAHSLEAAGERVLAPLRGGRLASGALGLERVRIFIGKLAVNLLDG
ncbi:MAG TPA: PfkB family carbohydrate kinase, partial [Paracoccus sp. (in: a-proteobacteria)]|nr:PfkB family carbohydrate kinase [Paracoccus sp. (in: a-proteobacteria)]